uniref:Prostaglandin E2 receptor EP4 subtype n=1 Tax=Magallana gigas TaxID=29159 RepID=K1QBA9_MAGGI
MANESSSFSIETAESPSIVPPVLLCILGVAGNAIAVAVVCSAVKSDQWQPFYRFVCGLALTDGLGVMLAVPFAIHRYATDFEYNYSQTVCDYMAVVQMFTIIASAMIVCTMSLERFMAIVFPYVYKSIQKGSRSLVMLVCVWALSAFLSSGHLMAGRHSRLFYPDSWCFMNMLQHLIGIHENSPSFELLGIEMATANSVIDPWVYIIFRRETFTLIRRAYYTCTCTRMPVYSSEAKQSTDCTQPMNRENGDLNKEEA